MKYLIPLTLIALALTPWQHASAQSGEVTLIAPGGIREAMEQMIPGFEKKTGYKVKPVFGTGLVTKKQVASGDDFDVAVVQPPYPAVIASGNALDDTATPLASSAVGVAVRHGAPKPDISTPDAVKRMLLAAQSVAYPAAAIGAAHERTRCPRFPKQPGSRHPQCDIAGTTRRSQRASPSSA